MPNMEFRRAGLYRPLPILAAALSIVLWIGVVTAGRWIGYWEPKGAPVNAAQVFFK